jgi:hypothetical protein
MLKLLRSSSSLAIDDDKKFPSLVFVNAKTRACVSRFCCHSQATNGCERSVRVSALILQPSSQHDHMLEIFLHIIISMA